MTKHKDLYVEVEYDGPIDSTGKRHIGPFIASGAKGIKVLFLPGANRLSVEKWLAVCDTQAVKDRLEEGHFTVLHDDTASEAEHHDITSETHRRALALVHDTIDPDVLMAWREQEGDRDKPRKSVLKALDEQLTYVETDPAKQKRPELRPHKLPEGV